MESEVCDLASFQPIYLALPQEFSVLFQFSVWAITGFAVLGSPMENIQAGSKLHCEGSCELGKILNPS